MPIVEAVMVASLDNPLGRPIGKPRISALIEKAMSEAIAQANAEGIHDPVEIKARMMAAREAVKAMIAAASQDAVKKENGDESELVSGHV